MEANLLVLCPHLSTNTSNFLMSPTHIQTKQRKEDVRRKTNAIRKNPKSLRKDANPNTVWANMKIPPYQVIDNVRTRSVSSWITKPLAAWWNIAAHNARRVMNATVLASMLRQVPFRILMAILISSLIKPQVTQTCHQGTNCSSLRFSIWSPYISWCNWFWNSRRKILWCIVPDQRVCWLTKLSELQVVIVITLGVKFKKGKSISLGLWSRFIKALRHCQILCCHGNPLFVTFL